MFKNNTTIQNLEQLDFLCGEWQGNGISISESVIGYLQVGYRFEKSFIEINETLTLPSGELLHEDCTWISFHEKRQALHATQFMAPGIVETKLVMLTQTGCRWWMGPHAPWVDFINLSQNELKIEIIAPHLSEPETWIHYQRK